jgi:MGT family glycosyltransferase
MKERCIAFFSMPDPNHFRRLLPLIQGLAELGNAVHVFSHERFRTQVESVGARFIDLFSRYPLEQADPSSLPRSCRYVTYAAHYAEAVCDDIRQLRPDVIVYGTFTVIGYVVAQRLGIPYVNVCAGHNVNSGEFLRSLPDQTPLDLHPNCWKAVKRLREQYGMHDAGPFSFIATVSPFLNVYCEPPEFLKPIERKAFEPIVFFGPVIPDTHDQAIPSATRARRRSDSDHQLRAYVSFGTIIWRRYAAPALSVLQAIGQAFSNMEHARALITLGGHDLPREDIAALQKTNVKVEAYVDQWERLQDSDVFITHHGVNSTHEAIFHCVPMISYPFFWDQPALARRCQEYGLAIPLVDTVRGTVRPEDVTAAVVEAANRRDSLLQNLQTACEWEKRAIAGRGEVLQRIASLACK